MFNLYSQGSGAECTRHLSLYTCQLSNLRDLYLQLSDRIEIGKVVPRPPAKFPPDPTTLITFRLSEVN